MKTAIVATPTAAEIETIKGAINREHHAAESAAKDAIDHALKCGELLVAAKEKYPHGSFTPFLRDHFDGCERTAQRYMLLFRERAKVANLKTTRVSDLTIREAIKHIATTTKKIAQVPEQIRNKVVGEVLQGKSLTIASARVRVQQREQAKENFQAFRERVASPAFSANIYEKKDIDAQIAADSDLSKRAAEISAKQVEHDQLDAEYNRLAQRLTELAQEIDQGTIALREEAWRRVVKSREDNNGADTERKTA